MTGRTEAGWGIMKVMKNLVLAAVLAAGTAVSAPVQTPHVTATLVAAPATVKPGQPIWVGVRLQMEPGWHIYWRNPGDSGNPTMVTWKLPPGCTIGELQWPRPERMVEGPMVTYGYSGSVLLMARLTTPSNMQLSPGIHLEASASWLVCRDMCVPGRADLVLDLSPGKGRDGPDAELFARTRRRLPEPVPSRWRVGAYSHGSMIILTLSGTGGSPGKPALFFPLDADLVSNTAKQVSSRGTAGWMLALAKSGQMTSLPGIIRGVLVAGGRALEIRVPIGTRVPAGAVPAAVIGKETTDIGVLWAVIFAFLGGLILNLMPCVFPVLSIKVLGFVRESSHHPHEVRLHGLLYGLGVVVMFWVLALALILLRAGGQQLGWGFQLQSPGIILMLTVILFLLSLNLMGLFEVGTTIVHATGKFTWSEGRLGAFLTGVLATVLATPCTAPFMGTAVGYAATQPMLTGMGIFTSMGAGMALPYVALSFVPRLGHYLPRPGRWMETFKQMMAFPLLATVIWLIWVLGLQAGMVGVISALGTLFVAGVAGWLYGRWHTSFMRVVAVALVVSGVLLAVFNMRGSVPAGAPAAAGEWQEYSRPRLEKLLAQGQPVFVDFTAAWCLTCKVNELAVLDKKPVMEAFRRHKVTLVRADWTNSNAEIEQALAGFGRNGVPLYLLYSGERGINPRILPQILTPQIVLRELDKLPRRK